MGGGRYERVDRSILKIFRLTILFECVIFMFFLFRLIWILLMLVI